LWSTDTPHTWRFSEKPEKVDINTKQK